MSSVNGRLAGALAFVALAGLIGGLPGCGTTDKHAKKDRPAIDPRDNVVSKLHPSLHGTIGELAILADSGPLVVEGYGIVAGLPGTGSGDMPPTVREILMEGLYKAGAGSYMHGTENISPERILSSTDNEIAAVEVRGIIPPLARRGDSFDLVVNCLADSQATSLAGGLLWTSELKQIGLTADTGNDTHAIALGRGPVFLPAVVESMVDGKATALPGGSRRAARSGRVIGGGRVAEDRLVRLQIFTPSNRTTLAIERAINSRFPGRDKCAEWLSDTVIGLKIPPAYANCPADFVNLVRHMYLSQEAPGFTEHKAAELIRALHDPASPHADISLALQGLGRSILPDYLTPQYTNPDPEVRFWCARAGAALQDVSGMVVLQEFAADTHSPLQKLAVSYIVGLSRGGDTIRATETLGELLKASDIGDRIAAYEGLLSIRSEAVKTYSVGGKFLLDIVPSDSPPLIYATQAGWPRIALIGRLMAVPPGVLYVSPDEALTVNALTEEEATGAAKMVTAAAMSKESPAALAAPAGGAKPAPLPQTVTVYWRSPFGDRVVNVKTSSRLDDVLARVGYTPDPRAPGYDPKEEFVGASYQRVVEMLAGMCQERSLEAQFVLEKAPPQVIRTPEDIINGSRPEGSTREPVKTGTTRPTTAPAIAPATQPATQP